MGTATVDRRAIMIPAMIPDMNLWESCAPLTTASTASWPIATSADCRLNDDPRRTPNVYLSGMGTLYISSNAGKTWVTRQLPASALGSHVAAVPAFPGFATLFHEKIYDH